MHKKCNACWGSHACDLKEGHDGNHICSPNEIGDCCMWVNADGVDEDGYVWTLYEGCADRWLKEGE